MPDSLFDSEKFEELDPAVGSRLAPWSVVAAETPHAGCTATTTHAERGGARWRRRRRLPRTAMNTQTRGSERCLLQQQMR